jgi:MFS transporter, DHA1 family, tetracycline resistance protein
MSDHVTEEPLSSARLELVSEAPSVIVGTTPRSAMFIVFLVVFIDLLGFGIVLPLLPRFGDEYIAAVIPGGKEARLGGAVLGLLMASFSLMQFIFAPLWGRLSDHVGRRPVLLVGLLGSVVFYSLFGYTLSIPPQTNAPLALALLFVARIGAGIAGATISTAQAVIADCTPPEKRKHGMALIGMAFGIGFTFGPLLGAGSMEVFPHRHEVIGYTAAALSFAALILGMVLLPETRQGGFPAVQRRWLNLHAWRIALATPAIAPVVLTFFLATLGFGSFETTLSLINHDALGLADKNNFLLFAYVGFVLMLTQGLLYRRLAHRVSETTFMLIGLLLMALGVGSLAGVNWVGMNKLLPFEPLLAWMMASMTLAVIGFAFLTPSAQALVSRRTEAARQGEVLGVNQSASAMARILGPILGLSLYKATDTHLLPYVFGALLLLAMLPLIPYIRRGETLVAQPLGHFSIGHLDGEEDERREQERHSDIQQGP